MLGERYSSGDGISTRVLTSTGEWFASNIESLLQVPSQFSPTVVGMAT
jgi:hypothetical protein